MLKKVLKFSTIFIIISAILPQKANAYLDPGSGSYLIQIVIASIAGVGFILKSNWQKVKSFFQSREKERPNDREEDK